MTLEDLNTQFQNHDHDGLNSLRIRKLVAGSDTEVQFNDGGSLGTDSSFRFDKNNSQGPSLVLGNKDDGTDGNILTPTATVGTNNDGISFNLIAGSGDGSGDGGELGITSGDADATGNGGDLNFTAGNGGSSSGHGGNINVFAGEGDGEGHVSIQAGTNPGNTGGGVTITAGGGDVAGDVTLALDRGTDGSSNGKLVITGITRGGEAGISYRLVGGIKTTTATVKTVKIDTLVPTASLFVEARVGAIRTGGSSGSDGDSAGYIRRALYKRSSVGSATLVGSVQDDFTQEDQAGWDATFVISTNDIQLQVTGATDNNITWEFEVSWILSH